MKYQALKGMSDILPGEIEKWQCVESRARDFFQSRGFQELRTPALEQAELFQRSIGEASDIVHKEMYTFEDRGGRWVSLRPEMTASVVRSAVENHLLRGGVPRYFYYMGPMFRAERPQAGRKRQFHQMGVEILNAAMPDADIFLLKLADGLLKYLGLSGVRIKINNLGTPEDRTRYAQALEKFFLAKEKELCEDCRFRLTKNVIRILDCKVDRCRAVIEKAPPISLSDESRASFAEIMSELKKAGVEVEHDSRIVRGLDYYTGCVFEVTAQGLGAQDAVLAGGRYDGLVKDLGGSETGACGFAAGLERILASLDSSEPSSWQSMIPDAVYFAPLSQNGPADTFAPDLALEVLDKTKLRVHMGRSGRSLRDHLKSANEARARFIVILGDEERKKGKVSIKDLESGAQAEVDCDKIPDYFLAFHKGRHEASGAC